MFCKKDVLKNSKNLQENICATVFFLIKSQASVLQLYQERDSDTSIFLWIFQNF